jgi:hypothetical protein
MKPFVFRVDPNVLSQFVKPKQKQEEKTQVFNEDVIIKCIIATNKSLSEIKSRHKRGCL